MEFTNNRYSRGGGRGKDWNRGQRPAVSVEPSLPAPIATQKCLRVIPASTVQSDGHQQTVGIQGVRYVASYNWVDKNPNTILIPGKPPKWLPPSGRQQLHEDHGSYYRDPNAARFPSYPTEPAVRAIYELDPEFDSSTVDIFGCGSTLGSILSFVRGEERTFRFGVQRIGQTVFFVRKTATPKELITNVRGYGHSFPEAYTVWGSSVKGSSSHQRIIRYDFGGLKCMIRSECDGYLPSKLPAASLDKARNKHGPVPSDLEGVSLEDAFSALGPQTQQSKGRSDDDDDNKLKVKAAGAEVSQEAIFDLKTRSARRKHEVNLSEFLPRLWANQTPNFILAWHNAGTFTDIEIKDVRGDVARWERSNQALLLQFRATLDDLLLAVSKTDRACVEVRRTGKGDLEIWGEVPGWSALPSELRARWVGERTDKGKGNDILGQGSGLEKQEDEKAGDSRGYLRF